MPKILIIDDDPQVREAIRYRLEQESYTVLTAENGTSGLELANEQAPEVIVLDLAMPDLDGIEVFDRLRQNTVTWDIPVIVLTAQVDVERRRESHQRGAARFLSKPFSPRHLLFEIDRLLSTSVVTQSANTQ